MGLYNKREDSQPRNETRWKRLSVGKLRLILSRDFFDFKFVNKPQNFNFGYTTKTLGTSRATFVSVDGVLERVTSAIQAMLGASHVGDTEIDLLVDNIGTYRGDTGNKTQKLCFISLFFPRLLRDSQADSIWSVRIIYPCHVSWMQGLCLSQNHKIESSHNSLVIFSNTNAAQKYMI